MLMVRKAATTVDELFAPDRTADDRHPAILMTSQRSEWSLSDLRSSPSMKSPETSPGDDSVVTLWSTAVGRDFLAFTARHVAKLAAGAGA